MEVGPSVIPLSGRASTSNWSPTANDIWKVEGPDDIGGEGVAVRISSQSRASRGSIYISDSDTIVGPGPTIHLPANLQHIGPGDVISISPDGHRVNVVWKSSATHNSILLTERCDNYCIMCSQPPKDRDDSYLYARAKRIVDALPIGARSIALTGGEPTVDGESFLELLRHISISASDLSVHILSNGRKFADQTFTEKYASIGLTDAMVGIPMYSSEPSLHDYVVQAKGAFDETIRGILALGAVGAQVELRVVIQQATVPVLSEIATYIARNLPFVAQVALMGLEMTGLARPNASIVWIDPQDYRAELTRAYRILADAGLETRIYNHPLCVIDQELWPAAVQSISEWKNDFPDVCEPCVVRDQCAGVFSTSHGRVSAHLKPVLQTVGL
jgi:His-Xaa-Ser system radical SAM maturase HxsC